MEKRNGKPKVFTQWAVATVMVLGILVALWILGLVLPGPIRAQESEQEIQDLEGAMHALENSMLFIHNPELKDFSAKAFNEAWEPLTITQKRKLVEMKIKDAWATMAKTMIFLAKESKKFPFHGIGIGFSNRLFDAIHLASPIAVEQIHAGGPASDKLQKRDLILAVGDERFDDFNFDKYIEKLSMGKMEFAEAKKYQNEIEESYRIRFLEAITNSPDVVKMEILRNHDDSEKEKKLTVEVEKALIGKDYPKQIENLLTEYRSKLDLNKSNETLQKLTADLDKAPEKDLKDMFEKAFVVGLNETYEVSKKYKEIVYEK